MRIFKNSFKSFSFIEVLFSVLIISLGIVFILYIFINIYPLIMKLDNNIYFNYEIIKFENLIREILYKSNTIYCNYFINNNSIITNNMEITFKKNTIEINNLINRKKAAYKFKTLNFDNLNITYKLDEFNLVNSIIFSYKIKNKIVIIKVVIHEKK